MDSWCEPNKDYLLHACLVCSSPANQGSGDRCFGQVPVGGCLGDAARPSDPVPHSAAVRTCGAPGGSAFAPEDWSEQLFSCCRVLC